MSPCDDWPVEASGLAAVVADGQRSLPDRQHAMSGLEGLVLALARQVLAPYRGLLPVDDMVRAAPGEVWLRLPGHFNAARLAFRPWCRAVLRNWARDACRAVGHDPLHGALPVRSGDAADDRRATANDPRGETAQAIRAVLDEVRAADWRGRDVDFYAVFLVHLRLCLAARASDAYLAMGPAGAGQPPTLAADWAAVLVSWHESEGRGRFRPNWPELRRVWAAIRAALLQPPHRVEGASFCRLVTVLLGGVGELTQDAWYQWVRRARDRAETLIGPSDWQDWFAPWLAPRRPRPASAPAPDSGALA